MDFMFEDDVDEVGSDVEAYCPKCKADTTHVVISKYEDEIRRVQCNPCGDVHSFRKPRGETEDDVPEPVAAKKRALLKKPGWEEFFARRKPEDAKPYEFREAYRENVMVNHPKFGVGFVSEVVSDSKVEITFRDARRILVHNRRDIPGLPLAAEGDGMPTPGAAARPRARRRPRPPPRRSRSRAKAPRRTRCLTRPATRPRPSWPRWPSPARSRQGPPSPAEGPAQRQVQRQGRPEGGSTSRRSRARQGPAKAEPSASRRPSPSRPRPPRAAAAKSAAKSAAKKPAPKPPAKKKAGKKR